MKLRPDTLPMIDLTRSLPSLQDSLTPPQTRAKRVLRSFSEGGTTATEDWLGGTILAALIIIAIALTYAL